MSSISSVSNAYSQIYSAQSSQTTAAHGKHHHQKANSDLAVSDQVSISSDGMAALQKDRMQNHRVNPLDSLVESGTITEDQKTAIDAAFKAAHDSEKVAESGAVQTDPLASLVTSGTITDDQKTAIQDAFEAIKGGKGKRPDGPPPGGRPPGPPPSKGLSSAQTDSVLSSLTASGTITEDQKTAVQKALQAMVDALSESDSTDSSSSTDSTSSSTSSAASTYASTLADYLSNTSSSSSSSSSNSLFDDILANLVEKGTLTEEQKKTVTQTLQAYNPYSAQ